MTGDGWVSRTRRRGALSSSINLFNVNRFFLLLPTCCRFFRCHLKKSIVGCPALQHNPSLQTSVWPTGCRTGWARRCNTSILNKVDILLKHLQYENPSVIKQTHTSASFKATPSEDWVWFIVTPSKFRELIKLDTELD